MVNWDGAVEWGMMVVEMVFCDKVRDEIVRCELVCGDMVRGETVCPVVVAFTGKGGSAA